MPVKIATWNLDRSGTRDQKRWGAQLATMQERNAVIWILTEAHRNQRLGAETAFSSLCDGFSPEECAASICGPLSVRPLELVSDPSLSVCAEVALKGGELPWIVYGTIIPYAADGAPAVPRWTRHREACEKVIADCERLLRARPHQPLVLAGDFNMNLDGTRWYGLNDVKRDLWRRLNELGMQCCTADDLRATGLPRANIDHIWISAHLRQLAPAAVWYDPSLSDHNGTEVTVENVEPLPGGNLVCK